MKKIKEGNLTFEFDDKWSDLIKFDENPDYKKIEKLDGTKAVDFLGILNNETVVFVEVKDFRGYRIENKKRIDDGELYIEIAQKVRDSIACIIGGCRNSTHLKEFWLRIGKFLIEGDVRIVFWLEQDRSVKLRQRSKAGLSSHSNELKKKLKWLTTHTAILDRNSNDQNFHFEVKSSKFEE